MVWEPLYKITLPISIIHFCPALIAPRIQDDASVDKKYQDIKNWKNDKENEDGKNKKKLAC